MRQARFDRFAQAAMAILAIAVGGVVIVLGRQLAPSPFEPIGPGAVPIWTAVVAVVLGAVMLAGAVRSRARPDELGGLLGSDTPQSWALVVMLFGLAVVYVAALGVLSVRYSIATAVFAFAAMMLLSERPRRALLPAGITAVVLAAGLDYVFRYVLVTRLP